MAWLKSILARLLAPRPPEQNRAPEQNRRRKISDLEGRKFDARHTRNQNRLQQLIERERELFGDAPAHS